MAIDSFPTTVRLSIVRLWLPRCCRRRSRAWTCTQLENLLHPLVLDDLERFWSGQEEAGRGYAVAEVPLWFESRLEPQAVPENGGPTLWGFPASRANAAAACWKCGAGRIRSWPGWTASSGRRSASWRDAIRSSPIPGRKGRCADKARAFVREMEHWDAESRAAFLGQWEHLVNEPCPEAG